MSQDTLFLSSLTLFLTIEGGQKRLFLSSLKAVLSSFFWIKKALERCPGLFVSCFYSGSGSGNCGFSTFQNQDLPSLKAMI